MPLERDPQKHQEFLDNAEVAAWEAQEQAIRHLAPEIVRAAELLTALSIGDQAERFSEAAYAARWAAARENYDESYAEDIGDLPPNELPAYERDIDKMPGHPGPTPLAYAMSKAIGPTERAAVVNQYVNNPESIPLPPDPLTGRPVSSTSEDAGPSIGSPPSDHSQ